MRRLAILLAASVTTLCVPLAASATPNFPPEIQTHLTLSYQPACAVCHLNGVTGLGTVTTPFGVSMRAQGCVANDTASLDAALDALAAAGTDSDGDGVGDIAELQAGTDPNTPGQSTTSTLTPKYGCGGGSDLTWPASPSVAAGTIALASLLALAVLRRRRAA